MFGRGHWRAFWRFVIRQEHSSKCRGIDDGFDSGSNLSQTASVRAHTVEPSWVSAVSGVFWVGRDKLVRAASLLKQELSLQDGTHDACSAYRWKPVAESDLRFYVIAYCDYVYGAVRFIVLFDHAFGLAVVLHISPSPKFQLSVPGVGPFTRDLVKVFAVPCLFRLELSIDIVQVATQFARVTFLMATQCCEMAGKKLRCPEAKAQYNNCDFRKGAFCS